MYFFLFQMTIETVDPFKNIPSSEEEEDDDDDRSWFDRILDRLLGGK